MSEVTTQDVRQAVVTALEAAFTGLSVFDESIAESAVAPYLLVKLVSAERTKTMGRRYMWSHAFHVLYTAESAELAQDMADALYEALASIMLDGPVRGKEMRHELVEGSVQLHVKYDFPVLRTTSSVPPMAAISQEGSVR